MAIYLTQIHPDPPRALVILKWSGGFHCVQAGGPSNALGGQLVVGEDGIERPIPTKTSEPLPLKMEKDLSVMAFSAFDAAVNNISAKSMLWRQDIPTHIQKKGTIKLQGQDVECELTFERLRLPEEEAKQKLLAKEAKEKLKEKMSPRSYIKQYEQQDRAPSGSENKENRDAINRENRDARSNSVGLKKNVNVNYDEKVKECIGLKKNALGVKSSMQGRMHSGGSAPSSKGCITKSKVCSSKVFVPSGKISSSSNNKFPRIPPSKGVERPKTANPQTISGPGAKRPGSGRLGPARPGSARPGGRPSSGGSGRPNSGGCPARPGSGSGLFSASGPGGAANPTVPDRPGSPVRPKSGRRPDSKDQKGKLPNVQPKNAGYNPNSAQRKFMEDEMERIALEKAQREERIKAKYWDPYSAIDVEGGDNKSGTKAKKLFLQEERKAVKAVSAAHKAPGAYKGSGPCNGSSGKQGSGDSDRIFSKAERAAMIEQAKRNLERAAQLAEQGTLNTGKTAAQKALERIEAASTSMSPSDSASPKFSKNGSMSKDNKNPKSSRSSAGKTESTVVLTVEQGHSSNNTDLASLTKARQIFQERYKIARSPKGTEALEKQQEKEVEACKEVMESKSTFEDDLERQLQECNDLIADANRMGNRMGGGGADDNLDGNGYQDGDGKYDQKSKSNVYGDNHKESPKGKQKGKTEGKTKRQDGEDNIEDKPLLALCDDAAREADDLFLMEDLMKEHSWLYSIYEDNKKLLDIMQNSLKKLETEHEMEEKERQILEEKRKRMEAMLGINQSPEKRKREQEELRKKIEMPKNPMPDKKRAHLSSRPVFGRKIIDTSLGGHAPAWAISTPFLHSEKLVSKYKAKIAGSGGFDGIDRMGEEMVYGYDGAGADADNGSSPSKKPNYSNDYSSPSKLLKQKKEINADLVSQIFSTGVAEKRQKADRKIEMEEFRQRIYEEEVRRRKKLLGIRDPEEEKILQYCAKVYTIELLKVCWKKKKKIEKRTGEEIPYSRKEESDIKKKKSPLKESPPKEKAEKKKAEEICAEEMMSPRSFDGSHYKETPREVFEKQDVPIEVRRRDANSSSKSTERYGETPRESREENLEEPVSAAGTSSSSSSSPSASKAPSSSAPPSSSVPELPPEEAIPSLSSDKPPSGTAPGIDDADEPDLIDQVSKNESSANQDPCPSGIRPDGMCSKNLSSSQSFSQSQQQSQEQTKEESSRGHLSADNSKVLDEEPDQESSSSSKKSSSSSSFDEDSPNPKEGRHESKYGDEKGSDHAELAKQDEVPAKHGKDPASQAAKQDEDPGQPPPAPVIPKEPLSGIDALAAKWFAIDESPSKSLKPKSSQGNSSASSAAAGTAASARSPPRNVSSSSAPGNASGNTRNAGTGDVGQKVKSSVSDPATAKKKNRNGHKWEYSSSEDDDLAFLDEELREYEKRQDEAEKQKRIGRIKAEQKKGGRDEAAAGNFIPHLTSEAIWENLRHNWSNLTKTKLTQQEGKIRSGEKKVKHPSNLEGKNKISNIVGIIRKENEKSERALNKKEALRQKKKKAKNAKCGDISERNLDVDQLSSVSLDPNDVDLHYTAEEHILEQDIDALYLTPEEQLPIVKEKLKSYYHTGIIGFRAADLDGDGVLGFEEFAFLLYERFGCSEAAVEAYWGYCVHYSSPNLGKVLKTIDKPASFYGGACKYSEFHKLFFTSAGLPPLGDQIGCSTSNKTSSYQPGHGQGGESEKKDGRTGSSHQIPITAAGGRNWKKPEKRIITLENVRVRGLPRSTDAPIGVLPQGTEHYIVQTLTEWIKIRTENAVPIDDLESETGVIQSKIPDNFVKYAVSGQPVSLEKNSSPRKKSNTSPRKNSNTSPCKNSNSSSPKNSKGFGSTNGPHDRVEFVEDRNGNVIQGRYEESKYEKPDPNTLSAIASSYSESWNAHTKTLASGANTKSHHASTYSAEGDVESNADDIADGQEGMNSACSSAGKPHRKVREDGAEEFQVIEMTGWIRKTAEGKLLIQRVP